MFLEQMEEMRTEREEMFGFTEEEKQSWSSAGTDHRFTSDFLQSIENETNEFYRNRQAENPIEDIDYHIDDVNNVENAISSTTNASMLLSKPILSHVSEDGQSIQMVDVGGKQSTVRTATAQTKVIFPQEVLDAFYNNSSISNTNELVSSKGPIFATAKIAGIMSAKRTSDMIPLCHPIALDSVTIDIKFNIETKTVTINCTCRTNGPTGVEMEALIGCSIAALTIYDMTKAASHNIIISETRLLHKAGGKRTVINNST